jgi:ABC-2 type transport system permease protein
MSALEESAQVAARTPATSAHRERRVRRPGVLTIWRWELRKLVSQKRTYVGLAIGVVFPLIFVIVENVRGHVGHGHGVILSGITQSGLATPVLTLEFESALLLPLAAALVAGDIVAAEDANGTLKTILTRSVDRGQVLLAKTLAAMTYTVLAVLVSAATATAAGVASWGFEHVVTLSGSIVSAPKGLLLVFAANACYLIPLLAVAAIGVLLSTASRNSAAAVVGTVAVTALLALITLIPGLEGVTPYLLTDQYADWHGLLRTPTDWAPVAHAAWVSALYGIPALLAAYLVFLRRDVAGG